MSVDDKGVEVMVHGVGAYVHGKLPLPDQYSYTWTSERERDDEGDVRERNNYDEIVTSMGFQHDP